MVMKCFPAQQQFRLIPILFSDIDIDADTDKISLILETISKILF